VVTVTLHALDSLKIENKGEKAYRGSHGRCACLETEEMVAVERYQATTSR